MSHMKDLYQDIVEMLDERTDESEIAYKIHCTYGFDMKEAVEMVEKVAESMDMVYSYAPYTARK